MLLLPVDDMLVMTKEFINPAASRAGLCSCFSRYGVNQLKELRPVDEFEVKPSKTFKSDDPGYLHVDIKYLPKMPDETQRSYLFVLVNSFQTSPIRGENL
ncbi:hypothetical protein C1H71_03920 [Iodobacter fluviatilis]|uniref:Uncharacterized protein n=1 Tax=Iodobacter fluviatilis TaxID=537 RepID=A0A7G3G6Q3_9NEIS|nr:hypothetical protein C1H71_03920 [Iodobacter fluviatilis]